jgi:hypothetical protein
MYLSENVLPPQPGKTYAINKKGSDTVITVVDGSAHVAMRPWEGLASQKWECIETDGWLGFICRASSAHLGHDAKETVICWAPHHMANEHFQVVLHDEGFALEIRKDNRLAFIGITGGGAGLKLSTRGTTWWGFTAIDGGAGGQLDCAPATWSLPVDIRSAFPSRENLILLVQLLLFPFPLALFVWIYVLILHFLFSLTF